VRSTSRRYASTLYVARRSERWAHGLRIRVMRYQLTIDPGSDPGTGRRRQVRRRFGTEKEARDALSEVAQQAAADQFVARRSVTVEQMCADWLKSLHNARATTIAGYTFVLAPLREQHGDLAAQKLTRAQLDTLLAALRAGGTTTAKGRARKPWSPRSLNAAIDAWRLALAYGVECRELARNPAAGMKKAECAHREMQTYTPDEISKVLRTTEKDRNGHLWWLALTPGALTHLWREATDAAGVKPIRLHDARHSCATAMHLRGTPTAVIAEVARPRELGYHRADLQPLPGLRARRRREDFVGSCDNLVTQRAVKTKTATTRNSVVAGHKVLDLVRRQGFEPRTR
jgi:integrase